MQNRYLGDIGDFGKFGLLRALTSDGGVQDLALAVLWYLVPDYEATHNGQHTSYLQTGDPRLRSCDPELFDALREIVLGGQRKVGEIERRGLLGPRTSYFAEPLSFPLFSSPNVRAAHRNDWLVRSLQVSRFADIVFVDPDNGLEGTTSRHSAIGTKFVYFDDLRQIEARGQSMVIYHHLDRSGSTADQASRRIQQLKSELSVDDVYALKFNRISPRFYFVIPSSRYSILWSRTEDFMRSSWAAHFSLYRN